jgi:hypothetical protein
MGKEEAFGLVATVVPQCHTSAGKALKDATSIHLVSKNSLVCLQVQYLQEMLRRVQCVQ